MSPPHNRMSDSCQVSNSVAMTNIQTVAMMKSNDSIVIIFPLLFISNQQFLFPYIGNKVGFYLPALRYEQCVHFHWQTGKNKNLPYMSRKLTV